MPLHVGGPLTVSAQKVLFSEQAAAHAKRVQRARCVGVRERSGRKTRSNKQLRPLVPSLFARATTGTMAQPSQLTPAATQDDHGAAQVRHERANRGDSTGLGQTGPQHRIHAGRVFGGHATPRGWRLLTPRVTLDFHYGGCPAWACPGLHLPRWLAKRNGPRHDWPSVGHTVSAPGANDQACDHCSAAHRQTRWAA